jgi:hypothetical protein
VGVNVSIADEERVDIANFQTTDTGSLQFTTRGPASTGMWVDWGDGTAPEWIQHIGTGSSVVTSHNYGGLVGTKKISFYGILREATLFQCVDSTFGGNISALSPFSGLTYIAAFNSSVSGDISILADIEAPETILFGNTSVVGDIVAVSAKTTLTNLQFHTTTVSGDIANLSALTALTNLRLYSSSVTGDVGDLKTLVNLTTLLMYSTTVGYNTTTLPAWNNANIGFQNCAWTQAEVDNFLADLDSAGGTNGTLNLSGSNSAPSAAGLTSKANLEGKGWTVTVTP